MPEDMDIYMKKIKQRADATDNVMDKLKADRMADLDKLRIDAEMEEVKAKLEESRAKVRESQQTGQVLGAKQAYNVAELLFAGRPPEEIKQIMDSLDEAALDKLAYFAATMNGQQLGAFTQTLRRPETNVKDTIELINTVVKMNQRPTEQQGFTLQGIAALMKEAREAAQTPQAPKESHTEKYLDLLFEELKLARQDQAKEREARLEKEIMELKNRPGFVDELTGHAEKFQQFQKIFGSPGGKTELDLKLMEMAQTERLENRKIDYATEERVEKRQDDKESTEQLYGLIKSISEGPVSKLVDALGGAAAKRIEQGGRGGQNPTSQLGESKRIVIPCPQCQKPIKTVEGAPLIVCQNCDAVLGLQPQRQQAQQSQPQEQSSVTQPPETQVPPQASEPEKSTDASQPSDNQPNKTE